MEEKDWIILQTVFEEKNITKAAKRLFMAQTTLTYRLQQMEKELGITLFYRGRRGVEFTAQGELLAKYAVEMLTKWKDTKETLLNIDGVISGTLKLGVTKSFAFYRLPAILKGFCKLYPNIDFMVNTGSNLDLTHSVYKQDTHIAIVRGIHHWPDEKQLISKENICVISKREMDIHELPYVPRIDYEPKPSLNIVIDNWWRDHFTKPPLITMKVDNVEIAKRMVMNDLGYTIAPGIVLEENDHLYKINLTSNKEPIVWETWMLFRKELLKLPAVKVFVEYIRDLR